MPHDPPAKPKRSELAPTSARDPLIDMQLGEYVVKRLLGVGGMGVVYAGVQPVIQKPVAIKILQADAHGAGSDEMQKLIAEARAANVVRHRGIVDVFSLGTLPDGRPYIVMELLDGEDLDAVIARDAPLSVAATLAILDDVLDTLSATHAVGVIHRDLKPGNLFMVRAPDGTSYTKILDFGLAKHSRAIGSGAAQATRVSAVVGTPHYMSPEQARGQPVSARTDLYAVGCIAFEMLTGRLPFEASTPIEMIDQHLTAPVPRISTLMRGVPEELEEIITQLMAKRPEDRPPSAQAVRQQLARLRRELQGEELAASQPPKRRLPSAWRPPEAADEKTAQSAPPAPAATPTPAPIPAARALPPKTLRSPSRAPKLLLAAVVVGAAFAAVVALLWGPLAGRELPASPETEEPKGEPEDKASPPPETPASRPATPLAPRLPRPPAQGLEVQRKKLLARIDAMKQKLAQTPSPNKALPTVLDEYRAATDKATSLAALRELEKEVEGKAAANGL